MIAYSRDDVSTLSGASRAQIDSWCGAGILEPDVGDQRKRLSRNEVIIAVIVSRLAALRISSIALMQFSQSLRGDVTLSNGANPNPYAGLDRTEMAIKLKEDIGAKRKNVALFRASTHSHLVLHDAVEGKASGFLVIALVRSPDGKNEWQPDSYRFTSDASEIGDSDTSLIINLSVAFRNVRI